MRDALNLKTMVRGSVRLQSGIYAVAGWNLVTYQGGDILAALLSGDQRFKISHMYFEFENVDGVPGAAAAARTDTGASVRSLATPRDLVRAPLVATPLKSAADANHAGNRVTFHALTTASVGLINGLPFGAASFSKVYAACLVAAVGGADHTQDLVYARWIPPAPLPVVQGQVSGTWTTAAN